MPPRQVEGSYCGVATLGTPSTVMYLMFAGSVTSATTRSPYCWAYVATITRCSSEVMLVYRPIAPDSVPAMQSASPHGFELHEQPGKHAIATSQTSGPSRIADFTSFFARRRHGMRPRTPRANGAAAPA